MVACAPRSGHSWHSGRDGQDRIQFLARQDSSRLPQLAYQPCRFAPHGHGTIVSTQWVAKHELWTDTALF